MCLVVADVINLLELNRPIFCKLDFSKQCKKKYSVEDIYFCKLWCLISANFLSRRSKMMVQLLTRASNFAPKLFHEIESICANQGPVS